MKKRKVVVSVLVCLALSGCGESTGTGTGSAAGGEPFTLRVGPTEWNVDAPAWFHDGTLHVGDQSVELGDEVDQFVLGATGAYWMTGQTLMFTSAEGKTEKVEDVGWGNIAVSRDRSVFATMDQSRGPTDTYGTHVLQLAVFDARTGEQLYRTPDEEPDDSDDLADLYGEIMPLLHGVSNDQVFFDGVTIDLDDGSSVPASEDSDFLDVYEGYAETLFPDGYRVSIRAEGRRRVLEPQSSMFALGRLSPDRSTIFDVSVMPGAAVVYDAESGIRRPIDAPWKHFALSGWSDEDTFYGVALHIDYKNVDDVLRARQVVTCELSTLACTPVSPVIATKRENQAQFPAFLMEGSNNAF